MTNRIIVENPSQEGIGLNQGRLFRDGTGNVSGFAFVGDVDEELCE